MEPFHWLIIMMQIVIVVWLLKTNRRISAWSDCFIAISKKMDATSDFCRSCSESVESSNGLATKVAELLSEVKIVGVDEVGENEVVIDAEIVRR